MKPRPSPLPALTLWLSLMLGAATIMYWSQQPPRVVPASAPLSEFSAERAMRHVAAIAGEPRPVGTAAHARARDYIVSELRALGLDPQIQATLFVDPQSPVYPAWSAAGNIQNVVARLAGTGGGKAILLVSHYDSVATAPGASDDGAGVATLLETARALRVGPPLTNDVILLFTDGEEIGLLGVQAFVEQHPWARDAGLALNFDTAGDAGIVYTYETSPGNADLIAEYARAVPSPAANSTMFEVYRTMPNESDFTPLKQAGIPGFNFAHIGGKYRYHTLTENVANLDRGSLQHQGSYALSLTRSFGDLDLTTRRSNGDAIYFNILNLGFVHYSQAWALPLAALAGLLFVGLAAFGWRRGKVTAAGLLLGVLAFALVLLTCTGVAGLAWQGLLQLYPQYGAVVDTPNGFFYWLALVTLALALAASAYNLLWRRLRVGDLALGALAWWLIAAVAASQWMPGASYVLEWPLLFSLSGLGLLWLLGEQVLGPWRRVMLLGATALPALLLMAWWPYALYLTLGTDLVVVPAVLLLLLFGLFIPHLDQFARPHGWVLPVSAGLVAVAALIAGGLSSPPDADHPQSDSVFYALNADTGQALWVSADPAPDAWTSQFLGTAYRRGKLPELFPYLSNEFLSAPAPALDLPAARVDLLSDRSSGGTRTLSLHVTAAADVQWVELKIRSASPIASITLAGTTIPSEGSQAHSELNQYSYTCQYWLPPAQGFELSIVAASPGKVEVLAQTYRYGLPQVPGLDYRPRAADRMPLAREFLPKNKTDLVMVARSFTFDE